MKTKKLNKDNPIVLKIEITYTFMPDDCLPDDFDGTHDEAVEYLRWDLAENFTAFANPRDIYEHITEEE